MNLSDFPYKHTAPVVIGGVGGSGTRLIAECLKEGGYFLGTDMNDANDNLWFTLLFKRIEVLSSSKEEFDTLVDIMVNGMTGIQKFTKYQINLIHTLASGDREQHTAEWLNDRANSLLVQKSKIELNAKWSWKEPNSHIVLGRLVHRIDNLKYIHVTRNGLDMAHSDNQNQLQLWGAHFFQKDFGITPYYSLKYWRIVHERCLTIGELMQDNFLFLNFDDFCLNPEKEVAKLCQFLKSEDDQLVARLIQLIHPPESIGRFKQYGTGLFDERDVAYVKSLGFDIECG